MIPFFRKIRKKLADDNKPLKYARYAIGEIVLVVIGILIALQVNIYNEKRKKRIEEKDILITLKTGLNLSLMNNDANMSYKRTYDTHLPFFGLLIIFCSSASES